MRQNNTPSPDDRRSSTRHPLHMEVNYRHDDTYLFSRTTVSNLSEMGIFIVAADSLPMGSRLTLEFSRSQSFESITVEGEVAWIKEGSVGNTQGMGIRFINLSEENKQHIQLLIRTMVFME